MEDLPIAQRDGSSLSPGIDPDSANLLQLLDSTSAAHKKRENLAAELQDLKALSRVVRRYLDPDLGTSLQMATIALSEFDRQPERHISRLKSQARPTEAVIIPLEFQADFKKLIECLSSLATMVESEEAINSIPWAQNRQLESGDIVSVTACLRKCLASFDHYSKLDPARILSTGGNSVSQSTRRNKTL